MEAIDVEKGAELMGVKWSGKEENVKVPGAGLMGVKLFWGDGDSEGWVEEGGGVAKSNIDLTKENVGSTLIRFDRKAGFGDLWCIRKSSNRGFLRLELSQATSEFSSDQNWASRESCSAEIVERLLSCRR